MRAGALRNLIAIQQSTLTDDGLGNATTTWADVTGLSAVNAEITTMRATESVENMQQRMRVWYEIRIRFTETVIKASWRVKYGTRYFNILGVYNPDNFKKLSLVLSCEEIFA